MTSGSISLGRAFRSTFVVRNRAAASDAANDTDDQIRSSKHHLPKKSDGFGPSDPTLNSPDGTLPARWPPDRARQPAS